MEDGIAEVARLSVNQGWTWKPMSKDSQERFDVLVIGGGPAGMAAAVRAAECGARVGVGDDNANAGGQIWERSSNDADAEEAENWIDSLSSSVVDSAGAFRCCAVELSRKSFARASVEERASGHSIRHEWLAVGSAWGPAAGERHDFTER